MSDADRSTTTPHNEDKAHACQSSLRAFAEDHDRQPNTHEKARLISMTIGEWERQHVAETHTPVTQIKGSSQ